MRVGGGGCGGGSRLLVADAFYQPKIHVQYMIFHTLFQSDFIIP